MRILYLANSAQIGGGNRVLLQLCAGVLARGHAAHVILPTPGPMEAECDRLGIRHGIVPHDQPSWRSPVAWWRSLGRWRRVLREVRPDVVHANAPATGRCAAWACQMAHVPVVCHVHFPLEEAEMTWVFRRMPKPRAFVFCSHAMCQEVGGALRRYSPQSQQIVIQNCIAADAFEPAPVRAGGRLRIGIIANLLPVKGHLDFLAMAAELTTRGVDAEYWVIGEDIYRTGYREQLQQATQGHGLLDRVSFLGHRSDIPDLLRQLDVVVCSSHVEPFGMCVLEALAAGRPVAATRVGGIPEIVEDGCCGFLVPPKSPSRLADAVQRLAHDGELRAEFGKYGRDLAMRRFNQDVDVDKMLTAYQQALADRSAAA